jgi:hypothetical protein
MRCIECAQPIPSLYTDYGGPEKIVLAECSNCKAVADKYIGIFKSLLVFRIRSRSIISGYGSPQTSSIPAFIVQQSGL